MLFWPWRPSDSDELIHHKQIPRLPVIISLLGRFWHPASRRLRSYKYQMYTHTGAGGMLCASLRASVTLALSSFPVWFINHLYGPFPTTYTWGYYRSDVSGVFGKWLDKTHVASLHAWARAVSTTNACRAARLHQDFRLHTAAAWLMLRNCFHEHFNDPREPPSARTTDMVQDAGTGLTNVVLWDLAFLAFSQPTSLNGTTKSISMYLWANLAQY